MSPASLVLRLTPRLAPGYDSYGFRIAEDGTHTFPEVVDALLNGDLPGAEFFIGGKIVRDLDDTTRKALENKGVSLERSAEKILELAGARAFE
jgi:CRISPR-associated protein Cst2